MNAKTEVRLTQDATQNALHYKGGVSFSDGNIVVGTSDTQFAISFNNTPHNQNSLLVLERKDVIAIYALLTSAMKTEGMLF